MKNAYLKELKILFESKRDDAYAIRMKKYMRDLFEYYGIRGPVRKDLQKQFIKKNGLPETKELKDIVIELWDQPQREYQYMAMNLMEKCVKKVDKDFISFYEYLIVTKSWWDTVDLIASHLVGMHFKIFPEMIKSRTDKWMNSENMWLQRTCIIFQLGYKSETDFELLTNFIHKLSHSKEFFIQKAIGWSLREYSKTDEKMVRGFVASNQLAPLSRREAVKWADRKRINN